MDGDSDGGDVATSEAPVSLRYRRLRVANVAVGLVLGGEALIVEVSQRRREWRSFVGSVASNGIFGTAALVVGIGAGVAIAWPLSHVGRTGAAVLVLTGVPRARHCC